MKTSCLIIDEMHPGILPMLEEAGITVSYQPQIKAVDVQAALKGFQILIVRSKLQITAQVLEHADELKVIARAGAGVDNIDEDILASRNIKLVNAPEGNRDAVGEFTVGLLLSLFRNIVKADKEVRNYEWHREANRGEEVSGKTVAIIGYGNMGKAFAKRLQCFECRVLAYDSDPNCNIDAFAEMVNLQQVFDNADVISLHIPYTSRNYQFANKVFFEQFQKNIWVLNTARGEVMDYTAVVDLLRSGKIKGAALDVLENEKIKTLTPDQQGNFAFLSQAANVILSPHIGGWTHQSYTKINETLIKKIKALMYQEDTLR